VIAVLDRISANRRRLLGFMALLLSLLLTYRFGVLPLRNAQRTQSERVAALKARIAEAERVVANMPLAREEYERIGNALAAATNRFIMRPILGSYPAQRTIHRLAGLSSFSVESVREQGVQPTPRKTPVRASGKRGAGKKKDAAKTEPACFARYVVDLGGEGRYVDIIDLIERLEQQNPYMGVIALNVRAVTASPERHRVKMRLEWPVEAPAPASP
jgi:hypothetical protein